MMEKPEEIHDQKMKQVDIHQNCKDFSTLPILKPEQELETKSIELAQVKIETDIDKCYLCLEEFNKFELELHFTQDILKFLMIENFRSVNSLKNYSAILVISKRMYRRFMPVKRIIVVCFVNRLLVQNKLFHNIFHIFMKTRRKINVTFVG